MVFSQGCATSSVKSTTSRSELVENADGLLDFPDNTGRATETLRLAPTVTAADTAAEAGAVDGRDNGKGGSKTGASSGGGSFEYAISKFTAAPPTANSDDIG